MTHLCFSAFFLALAFITTASSFSLGQTQPRVRVLSSMTMSTSEYTSETKVDESWSKWSVENGIATNKILVRETVEEERGKGGVLVTESVSALEVLARIPRDLVLAASDAPTRAMEAASQAKNFSWATDLTAVALIAMHPTDDELRDANVAAKKEWSSNWVSGGWATDGTDLGPDNVNFGPKDVQGSLLATGSDNDHNIFAKFRMPCHPVVLRAAVGLAFLTGCTEDESREALTCRGRTYRSMRDALEALVANPSERKGSNRERRCWDVADALSRVLARATTLQIDEEDPTAVYAVVPLHERLAHCDSNGENSKLVVSGDEILLVATRDVSKGENITRDYAAAPSLDQDVSEGALRLLLQFGLPPSSW